MDLGVHLIDLALWLSESASVVEVSSHLSRQESGWPAEIRLRTLPLRPSHWTRVVLFGSLARGGHLRVRTPIFGWTCTAQRWRGHAERRRVVLRFRHRAVQRHLAGTSSVLSRVMGRPYGRGLGDQARKRCSVHLGVSSVIDTAVVIDRIYRTHR